MTRDELAAAVELRLIAHAPTIAVDVLDLFRQREETLVDLCRSAIQAEIDYRAALHAKTGSRYGADRYQRNLEAAATRRDAVRKELGL